MSEFKELIKSFEKSRDYVRDFFVYGFKTREDFIGKSTRTYDNERRRIESWLSDFIRRDYTSRGKNISLSIDSNLLDENPLYRVWKAKSFTDHNIFLHFHLLDYLSETKGETIEEIIDGMLKQYEIVLEPQMVRRKCNEYEKEGLLWKKKQNRTLVYGKTPNFKRQLKNYPGLSDALKLEQFISPFGILGNTILDNILEKNHLFRVKHSFFVHTLEDEVMLKISQAIKEQKFVELLLKGTKKEHFYSIHCLPIKFFISTCTGRRFLCVYYRKRKHFTCIRMDAVKKATMGDFCPEYNEIKEEFKAQQKNVWGVSFQNSKSPDLQHIKMTLFINEKTEHFVLERLEREKRGGAITKIAENTFVYENQVYDVNEMLPWLRTFIGRILSLETTPPSLSKLFKQDMEALYNMYDIKEESK